MTAEALVAAAFEALQERRFAACDELCRERLGARAERLEGWPAALAVQLALAWVEARERTAGAGGAAELALECFARRGHAMDPGDWVDAGLPVIDSPGSLLVHLDRLGEAATRARDELPLVLQTWRHVLVARARLVQVGGDELARAITTARAHLREAVWELVRLGLDRRGAGARSLLVETVACWSSLGLRGAIEGHAVPRPDRVDRPRWSELPRPLVWVQAHLEELPPRRAFLLLAARDASGVPLVPDRLSPCDAALDRLAAAVCGIDQSLASCYATSATWEELASTQTRWLGRLRRALDALVGPFLSELLATPRDWAATDVVVAASGPLACAPWDLVEVGGDLLLHRVRSVQLSPGRGVFLAQRVATARREETARLSVLTHLPELPDLRQLDRAFEAVAGNAGLALDLRHAATSDDLRRALDGGSPCLAAVLAHGRPEHLQLADGALTGAPIDLRSARALLLGSCLVGRVGLGLQPLGERLLHGVGEPFGVLSGLMQSVPGLFGFWCVVAMQHASHACLATLEDLISAPHGEFALARARYRVLARVFADVTPATMDDPGTVDEQLARFLAATTVVVGPA